MSDKQKLSELARRLADLEHEARIAAELKRWRIERALGLRR